MLRGKNIKVLMLSIKMLPTAVTENFKIKNEVPEIQEV
jgi:hypothetical protein